MKRVYWFITVCIIIGIAIFAYHDQMKMKAGEQNDGLLKQFGKIGSLAPNFELGGLDKKTYSLSSLQGKPVVISFWESWCDACKEEAPDFVKLYSKYRDGLEVYAINITKYDKMEDITQFVDTYHYTFPVLLDITGEVSKKYNVIGIPTTFFVDKDGKIIDQIIGASSFQTLKMKFKALASH